MSNEVMTRNSEWMNHIVNLLNRMVDNFERAVLNYRPMLDGERFMTDKELCARLQGKSAVAHKGVFREPLPVGIVKEHQLGGFCHRKNFYAAAFQVMMEKLGIPCKIMLLTLLGLLAALDKVAVVY